MNQKTSTLWLAKETRSEEDEHDDSHADVEEFSFDLQLVAWMMVMVVFVTSNIHFLFDGDDALGGMAHDNGVL